MTVKREAIAKQIRENNERKAKEKREAEERKQAELEERERVRVEDEAERQRLLAEANQQGQQGAFNNSASADGGPRSRVCARETLCSAPHRH